MNQNNTLEISFLLSHVLRLDFWFVNENIAVRATKEKSQ